MFYFNPRIDQPSFPRVLCLRPAFQREERWHSDPQARPRAGECNPRASHLPVAKTHSLRQESQVSVTITKPWDDQLMKKKGLFWP